MNFEFHIVAHGFEKAAKLEAELKRLGIAHEVKQAKSVANPAPRKRLDKAAVAAVALAISSNPDYDDKRVAIHTGVSRNTVNKIRRGIHPLSKQINVQPIKNGGKK